MASQWVMQPVCTLNLKRRSPMVTPGSAPAYETDWQSIDA
jgi:hypothetical protein